MKWWALHVQHTIAYVRAAKSNNRVDILRALMALVDGMAWWGGLIAGKAGDHNGIIAHGLMAEHVTAAKLLADRLPVEDEVGVTAALELLVRNADFQAMFFGASIHDFPHAEFRSLLTAHLEALQGYAKDWNAGNEASFEAHVAAAEKNAADLDQFTLKNLAVLRRRQPEAQPVQEQTAP